MDEITRKWGDESTARLNAYDKKRRQYPPRQGKTMPDLDDVEIGGSRQFHLAVLSVDIRAFTKMALNLDDANIQKLARLQALYLSEMSSIIKNYGGVTEKYTGDGVLGLFGTEYDTKATDDVNNAAKCALTVKLLLKYSINPLLNSYGLPKIDVGMGIDYGPVLIERVGLRGDNQFSLCGKTVSLAAKMQAVAKSDQIIVGENVFKRLTFGNLKASCVALGNASGEWQYNYPIYHMNTRWQE